MGALSNSAYIRDPKRRRIGFAILIAICLALTFFPQRFRAAVTMAPTDPAALGLGGALGQLGALNTVFGSQASVEVSLKIGRSVHTRQVVIKRLNLMKRMNFANEVDASRWLEEAVEVRSLRGGIVQIECLNRNPKLATELVGAMQDTLREQLAEIAIRQTSYKRDILLKLVADANTQLAIAQANYNKFRLTTRYSDPGFAIGAVGQRIPVLQAAIKAKEVELSAARQFNTDDNMAVRQILAQIDALKAQLAQFQALSPDESNSIGRVVTQSTEAERLERELLLAKSLYYNYRRFLEGTTVEDMTSSANLRILEQPFIETDRQFNLFPLVTGSLLLMLLLGIEFYRLRPPVGEKGVEE
jgi:capsule polysaccharide export protein KpsE/RkpR